MIFDHTPGRPWAEKLWQRVERYRGLEIAVWGWQRRSIAVVAPVGGVHRSR